MTKEALMGEHNLNPCAIAYWSQMLACAQSFYSY